MSSLARRRMGLSSLVPAWPDVAGDAGHPHGWGGGTNFGYVYLLVMDGGGAPADVKTVLKTFTLDLYAWSGGSHSFTFFSATRSGSTLTVKKVGPTTTTATNNISISGSLEVDAGDLLVVRDTNNFDPLAGNGWPETSYFNTSSVAAPTPGQTYAVSSAIGWRTDLRATNP